MNAAAATGMRGALAAAAVAAALAAGAGGKGGNPGEPVPVRWQVQWETRVEPHRTTRTLEDLGELESIIAVQEAKRESRADGLPYTIRRWPEAAVPDGHTRPSRGEEMGRGREAVGNHWRRRPGRAGGRSASRQW